MPRSRRNEGDGCSRWSVAGGDVGWFQLWQCVSDQRDRENREDCTPYIFFSFSFFRFFCHVFCLHEPYFLIIFLYFLCLQFLGFPIKIEEKEGSSHRPAARIFVRM